MIKKIGEETCTCKNLSDFFLFVLRSDGELSFLARMIKPLFSEKLFPMDPDRETVSHALKGHDPQYTRSGLRLPIGHSRSCI
jgi:hypothetical protein